jgi:hypothetical protein
MLSKPLQQHLHDSREEVGKIVGPEKRGNRYVYRLGEEILPQNMTAQEVRGLVLRARIEGKVYPPVDTEVHAPGVSEVGDEGGPGGERYGLFSEKG